MMQLYFSARRKFRQRRDIAVHRKTPSVMISFFP